MHIKLSSYKKLLSQRIGGIAAIKRRNTANKFADILIRTAESGCTLQFGHMQCGKDGRIDSLAWFKN
jgi:hypothetical protein